MANENPKPEDKKLTDAEVEAAKQEAEAAACAKEAADANAARELAAEAAASGTGYQVAPGMSISTRRGIVDADQPISELDFHRKEDLAELIERKAIVKVGGAAKPAKK
jgi:hypothetical protein